MAEEIGFENGRNSNFQGLVTLTLTLDPAIQHTVVHHSSTSIYIPNFIEIEETFCGRTDGHFPPSNIIRSTFGSRPNAANANGYNKSQYVNIVNSQTSATCSKQHVVHLCQQGSSFELCNCNWLFQCKFGTNEGQWTLEPAANWPVNNNRNLQKMTNKLQH